MRKLRVSVEIRGEQRHVGTISGQTWRDAVFQYDRDYMNAAYGRPISLSLLFQEEPFSADRTMCFFESLLPEGFSRRAVAQWAKVEESDYLSILAALGRECIGALKITESEDKETEACYEKLSERRVKELAAEGATRSAQILMETHLSLTGASGKAGLFYEEKEGAWYLPKGDAPSTHIVKQSHVRLEQIVLNEYLCTLTAKDTGIDVPDCFIIDTGCGNEAEVLFATKRYDRIPGKGKRIGDLLSPLRLHQEDFAQALHLPADHKYERTKQGYLGKMFDLLRMYSADPISDQKKLLERIVFNYLIGNTDCHLKNLALLFDPDLSYVRLAPAYDLVATRVYNTTPRMSFFIGEEAEIDRISKKDFCRCSKEIGFSEKKIEELFDAIADRYEAALEKAAAELKEQGFTDATDIKERILKTGGYALL